MSNAITLGTRTFEIVASSEQSMSLLGPRRGEYVLVRNRANQALWCLIAAGRRNPRAEWFTRTQDGAFAPVL